MLTSCVIPKGDLEELSNHDKKATSQHLELVCHVVPRQRDLESSERALAITAHNMQKRMEATDKKLMAIHSELARLSKEVGVQIAPLKNEITNLESYLVVLKKGYSELNLIVLGLQHTSCNGEFIWGIPKVAQRVRKILMGETISLYSAPFFTSPFGYKLCLRLHLNGDGAGKGTHLSFYLSIMKREFDDMLSWPFHQRVTMMLLDQDKRKNIVKAFRPNPCLSCFLQPNEEMNPGCGFPKFAPLSVLSNHNYVRNDTFYLKVIVDKTGPDQHEHCS